ncbi:Proteasome activator BLM10 [Coemansia sp. RSA 989]|nr:Proteasome activator BLM10 [Coemansia sp. RSA 989]
MRFDEVNWAQFLPYDYGNEDAEYKEAFVRQFKLSALSGDQPAIYSMLLQLDGQPLRIELCRILYELITTSTLNLELFGKCCSTLARMLRHEDKLTVDDLTFDWRKLYQLTRSMVFPKVWQDNQLQLRNKIKNIVELACEANRFFPQSAAMEVFQEMLPQIQFNSMDWQLTTIQLITLFVPTAKLPADMPAVSSGPQSTDIKRWLPTIFSLWSFNLRISVFDAYLMNLVTTLIVEQHGQFQLNCEQIQFVFASGLHLLNLPVSRSNIPLPRSVSMALADTTGYYRMLHGGALPLREERAHTFARFIVYTLSNDSASGSLELFEQLVQMIEPFFHPSNNGAWSSMLARLLRYLAKELLSRSRIEAAEGCKVPEAARLERKVRRRFVVSVRALAMLLLFSKDEGSVSLSHSTLKHLAELEPDLIFRPLLDTLYTAIDSVTETHRMLSAMRALAKLATNLSNFAHYPEGAQHIAPLLILTLPGIDVNDSAKAYFALSFISSLCHNGVVLDELPVSGDMPAVRSMSKASADEVDEEEPPEVDMEQIEWLTRASTGQFETWIDQFLRRVFVLMDNLSSGQDTNSDANSSDMRLGSKASQTTELVLLHCGSRYYPMITRLITNFATSITSLSAVDNMCELVSGFARAIPEHALASLLPICCERIREEIENGVGQTSSLSRVTHAHSETTLVWFASMLAALTQAQDGRQLLPYREQIISTVELLVDSCMSRHVYTVGSKILYQILSWPTRTVPVCGRSWSDSMWNDAKFRDNHFRYWGQHPDIADKDFSISWHIPTREEVDFVLELMQRIVEPRIDELAQRISTLTDSHEPSNAENVALHRVLTVLRMGIRGLGNLVPPPSAPIATGNLADELVAGDDASNMPAWYLLDRPVIAGYVFTDPNAAEYGQVVALRKRTGEIAARALGELGGRDTGNVENIKALIQLAESMICHHAIDRDTFSRLRRGWDQGMDAFSLDTRQSIMPRLFAIRRATLTQISRQLHNMRFMPVTQLNRDISTNIAQLCLSAYAEVRNYAVGALENIMALQPHIKPDLVPMFLAELDAGEHSDAEKMMGALRVMDSGPMRRVFLRDWRLFPKLALALCRAQHEDKPQVKKMVRNTAVTQVVQSSAPLRPEPPAPHVKQLIDALSTEDLSAAAELRQKECFDRYEFAASEHTKLMSQLVDILRDAGTTWRFAAIAGYYLDQLISVRLVPEPQLAKTVAEYLTSDLILFRERSALNLSQILGIIRKRSKDSYNDINVVNRCRELPLNGGRAMSGQQPYTELCARALEGDTDAKKAPFLDDPACGWLVWPETAKVYDQPPADDILAYNHIDEVSRPAYDAVREELFADGKWDEIARLFSVEGTRSPEEELFGSARAVMFCQAFSLFGYPLLERAWSAIEKLARENDRVGAQRAASEMVGGLLRGSKHWARASLDAMWERLIPLLDNVFAHVGPDTLQFWQVCLQFAFARRDPRRYLPLIRMLMYSRPFDPHAEAPFAEAVKLELLRVLLSLWDWRIASAIIDSRPRLLDALAHPYKQVRDVTGTIMYMLSSSEFCVSYANATEAIDDLARYGPLGRDFSHWAGTQRTQKLIAEMTQRVSAWEADHIPSNEGTSNYSRGSKTLLVFFYTGFRYGPRRLALEHARQILALLSELQEQHDDEEVWRVASAILQFLSQVLYTTELAELVATQFLSLLASSKWHIVNKTLPLLCTLTFANRFTLSQEIRARILDTISQYLEHDQIEVRQAASVSLTTLVKCASSQVISEINTRFSAKLFKRLPRKRHGRAPPKDPAAYNRLVLTRHAGVLGLSCLVLAFPYTVPDWMPEVLVLLAECIDDPNPIQSTVQRTFSEFRRTHMDAWHEDRKKFSSDQLEILTDMLVSPCYYA